MIASFLEHLSSKTCVSRVACHLQVDGCWVTSPARGAPKGIVHFLGGAFAGASPELVYPLLLQIVSEAGYTVVSTPYPVTFKHVECAAAVHQVGLRPLLTTTLRGTAQDQIGDLSV
jgi:acetyl esterase/lipase